MLKHIEIRKLLYGIGIATLVLMSILYLIIDNGKDYRSNQNNHLISSDSTLTQLPVTRDATGYIFKVFLVTVFIIAVLIIGARWFAKLNKTGNHSSFIKILSKQYIGPKQYLLLVVLEQKKMLLGITENSITHLADMGTFTEKDEMAYKTTKESPSFSSVLNYFRKDTNE